MTTLRAVSTDPHANGLYRLPASWSPTELAEDTAAAGAALAILDGDTIASKADLLRALAAELHFPAYFGRNWDALADCLGDLAWLPPRGQLILFDHPAPLIRQAPATWAMAAAIFGEAAAYWRTAGRPFSVLLRRTGGLVPTVPILDRYNAPER